MCVRQELARYAFICEAVLLLGTWDRYQLLWCRPFGFFVLSWAVFSSFCY